MDYIDLLKYILYNNSFYYLINFILQQLDVCKLMHEYYTIKIEIISIYSYYLNYDIKFYESVDGY